jgi:hypothetical protein
MKITRVSPMTQQPTTMELDVTEDQMQRFNNREGLIQDIFPNLSASEREFIKTGYTQADWDKMFPPEPGPKDIAEVCERLLKHADARADVGFFDDLVKLVLAYDAALGVEDCAKFRDNLDVELLESTVDTGGLQGGEVDFSDLDD